MILARNNQVAYEDFTVTDSEGNLITGLDQSDFTYKLYNGSGTDVSLTISVTISALNNGNYRASFTPNAIGTWYLTIYNSTYFPWGKSDSIIVQENNFDTLDTLIKRILGLTQENYYIDNMSYNTNGNLLSGRIRIYSNPSSVGTTSDVISSYLMSASYDASQQLSNYSVIKL